MPVLTLDSTDRLGVHLHLRVCRISVQAQLTAAQISIIQRHGGLMAEPELGDVVFSIQRQRRAHDVL